MSKKTKQNHAAIVSVALRNCIGEDVPVCYVQVQAEPSVQHIGGFTDAGLQYDGLCLALDKMENNNQLLHLYWCSAKVEQLHYKTRVFDVFCSHSQASRQICGQRSPCAGSSAP